MRELKSTSLLDILPPNLAEDETIRNMALAIDTEMQRTTEMSRNVLLLARIDELDDATIDLLAKQFKVDFYDVDTPLERKRELVRTSIAWHRKKGTPAAVQQVVDTLIGGAVVQENWEYGGEPYFFRVAGMKGPIVSARTVDLATRAINIAKNTRSHLEDIRFERHAAGTVHMAAPARIQSTITVYPHKIGDALVPVRLRTGAGTRLQSAITVMPITVSRTSITRTVRWGAAKQISKTITVYPTRVDPSTPIYYTARVNVGAGIALTKEVTIHGELG